MNITTNRPHIFPPLNNSHVLPMRGTIQRKYSSLDRLEAGLWRARAAIKKAKTGNQTNDPDYIPTGPMYWNAAAFHRYVHFKNHHIFYFILLELSKRTAGYYSNYSFTYNNICTSMHVCMYVCSSNTRGL